MGTQTPSHGTSGTQTNSRLAERPRPAALRDPSMHLLVIGHLVILVLRHYGHWPFIIQIIFGIVVYRYTHLSQFINYICKIQEYCNIVDQINKGNMDFPLYFQILVQKKEFIKWHIIGNQNLAIFFSALSYIIKDVISFQPKLCTLFHNLIYFTSNINTA